MKKTVVLFATLALGIGIAGCKRGEKAERGDATGAPLAATPAPSVRGGAKHVWDPNVVVLDRAAAGASEIERVPIGTKVTVETIDGNPAYVKVISGTKKKGFLFARSLRDEKPDAAALLAAARESLGMGDLALAIENAERVVALGGAPLGEALDLLEAIHEAQGNPRDATRVRALRASSKLPAPTPTPDAAAIPAQTAAAGDLRWVSATKLLVKEKPDVTARTVAELPINTQVKITAVRGEWLSIEATQASSAVFRIEADGAVKAIRGEGRLVRGFARPRFLADAALARDALLKEADALEAKAQPGEAVRRLERASALDPDPALVQRLARLATQAKLYRIAARAAARLSRGADGAGALHVTDIITVWGCRGDLSKALIFPMSAADDGAPDACITGVPTHDECAPCNPSEIMISEAASVLEALPEGSSVEERAAAEAGIQQAKDEFGREQAAYKQAERVWKANHEAWRAEREKLRALFPDGPYARISLPPSGTKGSLFAWHRTARIIEDSCALQLGWDSTSVSQEIPATSDRERTFWIYVDDPDAAVFGIDANPPAGDPGAGPSPGMFPKLQSCGCCEC